MLLLLLHWAGSASVIDARQLRALLLAAAAADSGSTPLSSQHASTQTPSNPCSLSVH
jgi:hypothetical protein